MADETFDWRTGADAEGGSGEDVIQPVAIDHRCDEIVEQGQIRQRYNYLEYSFELDGLRLRARAYLDEPSRVAIYPTQARKEGPPQSVEAPAFREAVLAYLRRRFQVIDEMALEADGYRTIWRREA